jgi:hypothetical protein
MSKVEFAIFCSTLWFLLLKRMYCFSRVGFSTLDTRSPGMAKNAAITALHQLMRDTLIPHKDFDKHVRELTGTNHRLVAIVCASLVELNLTGLIKAFLRNGAGSLFDPYKPLGTFAAKIEMAYALGLIDVEVRRNSDYIREIRNIFAHRMAPTNFNTKEVAAVCRLLVVNYHGFPSIDKPRERYYRTAIQTAKVIMQRKAFPWDSQPAAIP